MRKTGVKLLSILMAAAVSVSMISPTINVSASDQITAKLQKDIMPKKSELEKSAKKTEPEEWNKTDVKVYKFGTAEDAAYYLLTGGIKYYNKTYFKNPQKIKLTAVESGTMFVAISGDNDQAGAIYDADQKLIQKVQDSYVKAQVNAGDVYYVDFPRNCKEGLISAYILKNECTNLRAQDYNLQKGQGKETYHTFKMKKRGMAIFLMNGLIEDKGNTTYKIQKKKKGKWITIGKTRKFGPEDPAIETYGLWKGSYRLVLKSSKEQVSIVTYTRSYYKKNVAYSRSKAKNLDAENVYTTGEKAPRWYKVAVKSTKKQKTITLSTNVNEGGFIFTFYENGKNKPIKTVKATKRSTEKTIKLPKRKGTYYIKVSKYTKRTNGVYEIEK